MSTESTPTTEEQSARVQDSHARSLVKGLTWRFTATTTTFFITWILIRIFSKDSSGNDALQLAAGVAGVEFVLKLLVYYVHERVWILIPMR